MDLTFQVILSVAKDLLVLVILNERFPRVKDLLVHVTQSVAKDLHVLVILNERFPRVKDLLLISLSSNQKKQILRTIKNRAQNDTKRKGIIPMIAIIPVILSVAKELLVFVILNERFLRVKDLLVHIIQSIAKDLHSMNMCCNSDLFLFVFLATKICFELLSPFLILYERAKSLSRFMRREFYLIFSADQIAPSVMGIPVCPPFHATLIQRCYHVP